MQNRGAQHYMRFRASDQQLAVTGAIRTLPRYTRTGVLRGWFLLGSSVSPPEEPTR